MLSKFPASVRSWVYLIAFAVALVTVAAVVILVVIGAADLDTVKDLAIWVLGILGVGGHGLAVAFRPTKTDAG